MHCLFFENVVILETSLQEIMFAKNCKCFDILILSTIMVSNTVWVELHSLILENRHQIHKI